MMIDESEKAFDAWWANQNQTIGKVAAKVAWDHQQATIDNLEKALKSVSELSKRQDSTIDKLTKNEIKPPYVKPTIKVLEVVSDTPDRIWIDRHCWDTQESNIFDTEYTRTELVDALINEVQEYLDAIGAHGEPVVAAIKAIKGEG